MPKEVTISLKDLRKLVRVMVAYSIESRAHALLRKTYSPQNKPAVERYMTELRAAIPQAKKQRLAQFHYLLVAVKTGENLPLALATFADHEAKSSSEPDA